MPPCAWRWVVGQQYADLRHLRALLAVRRERRGEEATRQSADECPSVHYPALTWPPRVGGTGRAAISDLTTAESRAGVTG